MKYDGTLVSSFSILRYPQLFPLQAMKAVSSTLISPKNFKKSKVAVEKHFVKKISSIYGALGFIKLPFYTLSDFLDYAIKNKAGVLILSAADLKPLTQLMLSDDSHTLNGRHGLSVFIANQPYTSCA